MPSSMIFGRLVQKYFLILTGATLVDLIPTIQEDWKAPFRLASLPPDSEAYGCSQNDRV
jgi:hypothetical protein